jgi:hypothetical protein
MGVGIGIYGGWRMWRDYCAYYAFIIDGFNIVMDSAIMKNGKVLHAQL